jgi:hypothetical protein
MLLPPECNHEKLYFEFSTKKSNSGRATSWINYMNTYVANTTLIDNSTGASVERRFGESSFPVKQSGFDAEIQVSCYCHHKNLDWTKGWIQTGPYRMCVFHEKCPEVEDVPGAVWPSPHFKRYFIPHALPHFESNPTGYFDICSIGSSARRSFDLVVPFLQNAENFKFLPKIRIRMLGKGGLPKELLPFRGLVNMSSEAPPTEEGFYRAVKSCSMIVVLIRKTSQANYFLSPGNNSQFKLSGNIPPIIAFRKPFIVPDEILDLYKNDLPMDVPHASFDDDKNGTFAIALNSLLMEVLEPDTK